MDVRLDEATYALLQREQKLLLRMKELFERAGSDPEVTAQLADLAEHLSELFLVVVVGEFNAGKSRLLNALFGREVMPEGPTPTTDKITLLRHGEKEGTRPRTEVMVEKRAPIELLRDVAFVDTPGTNSIVQEHQQVTEDFIPRSDLVLFVTSYDRPLSDSERRFLSFIREDWGRRLVFVVNKADLAHSEEDLEEVIGHVKDGCRELLHFEPEVFPVSAEQAFLAKVEGDGRADDRWGESRFEALEDFIRRTLGGPERVAIKLGSPLEAGERLLGRFSEELADRRDVLSEDEDNLDFVEREIEDVRTELESGYERHLSEIDKLLMKIEQRGTRFLEDNIRVSKISLLRNKERFKEEFERQVVRDLDRQIEDHMTDAVDELTERALRLERQTLRTLGERMREAGSPLESNEGDFSYNRAQVHRQIMREAEREMQNYDMQAESRRILENVYNATDLLQKGGYGVAGLAGLSVVLMVTAGLDVLGGFGLATSAAVAGAGLFVLPRQRKKAKRQLTEHVEELREELRRALSGQLDREIDKALGQMRETVRPYAEIVSEERETLREAETERDALREELAALRTEVEERVGAWEKGERERGRKGKWGRGGRGDRKKAATAWSLRTLLAKTPGNRRPLRHKMKRNAPGRTKHAPTLPFSHAPVPRKLVVTFTKMDGAGNDFIVLDNRFLHLTAEELTAFACRFCPRRTGIGADGVLALDPSEAEGHHFRMRYRNADGSQVGLCGNGACCLARFARQAGLGDAASEDAEATLRFASDAGTHRATVPADAEAPVRFYAAAPHGFAEAVTLRTEGVADALPGSVAFVNTGTEHAVLFVEDAAAAPLAAWGPRIRQDAAFAPAGANANVVEVAEAGGHASEARLVVRTFEKGVEGETLACGTGALAAAVVAWRTGRVASPPVAAQMPGGLLRVGFRAAGDAEAGDRSNAAIEDLYLEGPAEATFQGTVEVRF